MKIYLAGPMSNLPAFNFPAFHAATADLRGKGWDVVSPAEEDLKSSVGTIAESSAAGDPDELPETWGEILARDVKLIADGGIEAIVFLPNWNKSRGARLEATVGLLQKGFRFFTYTDGVVSELDRNNVSLALHLSAVGVAT